MREEEWMRRWKLKQRLDIITGICLIGLITVLFEYIHEGWIGLPNQGMGCRVGHDMVLPMHVLTLLRLGRV